MTPESVHFRFTAPLWKMVTSFITALGLFAALPRWGHRGQACLLPPTPHFLTPTTLSTVAGQVRESGVFCNLALSKSLARLGPLLVLPLGGWPNTGFSLWSLSTISFQFFSRIAGIAGRRGSKFTNRGPLAQVCHAELYPGSGPSSSP